MLISSLEHAGLPVLTAIPHPVVLANGDGRVIASNSPHWAPGMSIALADRPRTAPVGNGTRTASSGSSPRSWVLVDVDAPAD